MKQSVLFPKTRKEPPKEAESINHKLLVQAGFIDQFMAGSWTLLPLGWRVVTRINNIIREEMNSIGCQEILMPLLHPKAVWNETGRWDTASEVMYKLKDTRDKEFALSFTHEEVFLDLVRKYLTSYKDLPIALYHFSTKFRNEMRVRSGIMRGREFMMKDMYSIHTDEEDFWKFYEKTKDAYLRIFKRIGFDFKVVEASGGVFTDKHTHEFQALNAGGEDTIYMCDACEYAINKEIFEGQVGDKCPSCHEGKIVEHKGAVEIGNIFPFGTYYSERMKVYYADGEGKKKPVWFGSYGIGSTRAMGTWVEVSHDDKGIIWSPEIAPFDVHLIDLPGSKDAKKIYEALESKGVEVLWDEREVGAGEKFNDSDLIGIPVRLVVSSKTGDKIEYKERKLDKAELITFEEVIQKFKKS